MAILLGPGGTAGLGYTEGLNYAKKLGLTALEVEFTYGVRMQDDEAAKIGKLAKQLGISLSIHAPYYINLCSAEKEKIAASKERILQSCQKAHFLGACYVVFHAGFYQRKSAEETYQTIKESIMDLQNSISKNKWDVALAPELTGKPTQFGDIDELLRLKKETGCHLCIDFAHYKARANGKYDYVKLMEKIKSIGHIHAHFSGIEWTAKGERRHLVTESKDIKELMQYLSKYKIDATIINESPDPFGDSVKTKEILSSLK